VSGSVAQVDVVVEELSQAEVLGQRCGRTSPALATACSSSKVTAMVSRL